jgi:hypothetical protein
MKPTGPFLEVVPGSADADPELERVLGAARALAEPEQGSRERVAAALRLALSPSQHSNVMRPGEGSGHDAHPGRDVRAPAPPAAPQPRAVRAPMPWLLLGGALLGALGFWLGHGVGRAAGLREALSVQAAAAEAARLEPAAHEPSRLELTERSPSSREQPAAERQRAAPQIGELEARGPSSPRAAAAKSNARSTLRPPEPELDAMSFRQVLDQLRRARQQLDNGQATLSLLLLSELDRGAGDILREERELTRVLALCAVGQHEAARRSAALLSSESPRSIYAMRLSNTCVGAGDSD